MKGRANAVVSLQGAVRPDFIVAQARRPVVTKDDKSRGGLRANRARSSPVPSCPQHPAGHPQPSAGRLLKEKTRGLSGPVSDGNHCPAPPRAKKTGDFHAILLLRYFPFLCRILLALFNRTETSKALLGSLNVTYKSREVNHISFPQLEREGRSQEHVTGAWGSLTGSTCDGMHARQCHDMGHAAQTPPRNSLK